MYFRVIQQHWDNHKVVGQSYDCLSATELTLKNMSKGIKQIPKNWLSNHNKIKHSKKLFVCILYATYWSTWVQLL